MRITRSIILTLACAVSGVIFSSCEKEPNKTPEETPKQETVSLKSTDNSQGFTLTHDKDGVHGTVEFNLTAKLSNPVKEDVTIKLSASCAGISSSKITLTPAEVKIKAGETSSPSVKASISDWSEVAGTEEEKAYSVIVKIASISGAENVSADTKSTITATVNKDAKDNGSEPEPEPEPGEITVSLATTLGDGYNYRTDENVNFKFKFYPKDGTSELENPDANTVIGNGNQDLARNDGLICFEVDFNETKNLSGLYFQHWGNVYCPQASKIYYSDNGTDWKYIGTIENGTRDTYYAIFSETLSTRYIKYEMTMPSANGRIDIKYFGLVYRNE